MQGLQVWDKQGKKVLDTNQRTIKVIKVVRGSATSKKVTFIHPFLATETPFYIIHPSYPFAESNISITFNSNQCKVIFTTAGFDLSDYKVIIGVY